jgi:hypothetical protein
MGNKNLICLCCILFCSNPIQQNIPLETGRFILLKDLEINDSKTIMGQVIQREIDCVSPPFECDDSLVMIFDTNFILPDSIKVLWSMKTKFVGNFSGICEGYALCNQTPFSQYLFPDRFLVFNRDSVYINEIDNNGLTIKYRDHQEYLTTNPNDSFVVADSILDTINSPATNEIMSIEKTILTHIFKIKILDMSRVHYLLN